MRVQPHTVDARDDVQLHRADTRKDELGVHPPHQETQLGQGTGDAPARVSALQLREAVQGVLRLPVPVGQAPDPDQAGIGGRRRRGGFACGRPHSRGGCR